MTHQASISWPLRVFDRVERGAAQLKLWGAAREGDPLALIQAIRDLADEAEREVPERLKTTAVNRQERK